MNHVSDKSEVTGQMDDMPRRKTNAMLKTNRHDKSRYDYEDNGVDGKQAKGATKEDKRGLQRWTRRRLKMAEDKVTAQLECPFASPPSRHGSTYLKETKFCFSVKIPCYK
jgi:hypothetical protein